MAGRGETQILAAKKHATEMRPQRKESWTRPTDHQRSKARKKEVHQPNLLRSPAPAIADSWKESASLRQPLCLAKDATRTQVRRWGGARSARPLQCTSRGQTLNSPRDYHEHPNSRAEPTLHLHQRTGKPKRSTKHTMKGRGDSIAAWQGVCSRILRVYPNAKSAKQELTSN